MKGMYVECRFRLTCGKRLLLYKGGEKGTSVPHGLHIIGDAIVRDGWHTIVATLI